jgi:uncharacterized protein
MQRTSSKAQSKVEGGSLTWLTTGALARDTHFLLAHGAGAGMASAFLTRMAELLDANGVTVHRFEFAYMAARLGGGARRPAPRAETLIGEYRSAIANCRTRIGRGARLFIGGKSMGGRIACLVGADAGARDFDGLAILGFPLVPPSNPSANRAGVIERLAAPTLIVQGTRDSFGGRDAFANVRLPEGVRLHWIADGDHDLKPRRVSGLTHDEALRDAASAITDFFAEHAQQVRRADGGRGRRAPGPRR